MTSPPNPRFTAWLYEAHPESELRRWATALRFFRFCRAFGGHANDGDMLRVRLSCTSEADLLEICAQLGLGLNPLPLDEPQPVPGQRYTMDEFARFRSPIPAYRQWQQPGHCELHGARAFVYVQAADLTIDVFGASGDLYSVDEVDFGNALRLEPVLAPLASRIIDPPQDNERCICPKYYPHFWTAPANPNAMRPPTSQEI